MNNKYYKQIDMALKSYENYKPYHQYTTEWICNKISWCNQWKKITKEQCDELCARVLKILEGEI